MASFTGNVINPITDARLESSMSQNALAKRLGLSRQYVSRAEQGTYSSLNPALKKWTAVKLSITERSVEKRYRVFQSFVRAATRERVDPAKLDRRSSSEPGHVIFERWRSGYWTSPVQFAVDFCVHPDTVQRYEDGIQKEMPQQVFNALREVNLIDEKWTESLTKV